MGRRRKEGGKANLMEKDRYSTISMKEESMKTKAKELTNWVRCSTRRRGW